MTVVLLLEDLGLAGKLAVLILQPGNLHSNGLVLVLQILNLVSHDGELCTFDTMLREWGLETEALSRLAAIVRGADTSRPDLAPQAEGLLAASLGFSRMYRDDLVQLDAAMALYDAFYRWSRDAVAETHNWPAGSAGSHTGAGA